MSNTSSFHVPVLCLVVQTVIYCEFCIWKSVVCVSCRDAYISCIKKPYRKCRFLGYFTYKRGLGRRLCKDASHRLIHKKIILVLFVNFHGKWGILFVGSRRINQSGLKSLEYGSVVTYRKRICRTAAYDLDSDALPATNIKYRLKCKILLYLGLLLNKLQTLLFVCY